MSLNNEFPARALIIQKNQGFPEAYSQTMFLEILKLVGNGVVNNTVNL
jgi:hypothetical protein